MEKCKGWVAYVSWDRGTKRRESIPVRLYLSPFIASFTSADTPVPQAAAKTAEDASGCVTRAVPVAPPEWAVAATSGGAGGEAMAVVAVAAAALGAAAALATAGADAAEAAPGPPAAECPVAAASSEVGGAVVAEGEGG